MTIHKLEIDPDKLRWGAEQEARITKNQPRPDYYRRKRHKYMLRLRPLLEQLNASTRDAPREWVCHSYDSVRAAQAAAQAAEDEAPKSKRQRKRQGTELSRWTVKFVTELPTAAQRWRLCQPSADEFARFARAGRVSMRRDDEDKFPYRRLRRR